MSEKGERTGLPEGWKKVAAGEILSFQYGKGLPARVRRPGRVGVFASAGKVGTHDESLVEGPVVVIGRKGAAGNVFVAEGPAWIIDTAYYVSVPAEMNPRFIAFQLQAAELARLDQSTAIPSLSRDDLNALSLRLPPPRVQDRIVAAIEQHLARVDRGVADLGAAAMGLDVLRRRALETALHLHETELPRGWQRRTLSEVAELSAGGTPSRSRPEYFGQGVPWIKIGDLNEGLVTTAEEYVTPEGIQGSSAGVLDEGVVMLAMYGASIGRTGFLGVRAATNQAICSMRASEDLIRPDFLHVVLRANKATFVAAGYGGAQPNISQRYLKSFSIPVPPLDVQAELMRSLEESRAALASATAQIDDGIHKTAALRRSVLHSALTGDLC